MSNEAVQRIGGSRCSLPLTANVRNTSEMGKAEAATLLKDHLDG